MSYSEIQYRALQILEPGNKGDWLSKFCDTLIALLVIVNIFAVTLESVSDFSIKFATQFYAFEFFSVIVFSIESKEFVFLILFKESFLSSMILLKTLVIILIVILSNAQKLYQNLDV